MWRDIKGYEGLYEINENAVVRRVDGTGIDGRKVSTHVGCVFTYEKRDTLHCTLERGWAQNLYAP